MHALTATDSRLKTTSGELLQCTGRSNRWCAACGGQYNWRNPNRILVIQESTNRQEAKVFRTHAPQHGVCDTLFNALKLLVNQYQDGDSLVRVLVEGFHASSRLKMMDEIQKFIKMDNHEAIRIGSGIA